jgi:hypothetical protein
MYFFISTKVRTVPKIASHPGFISVSFGENWLSISKDKLLKPGKHKDRALHLTYVNCKAKPIYMTDTVTQELYLFYYFQFTD